jgi:serine/threonine protein kinase
MGSIDRSRATLAGWSGVERRWPNGTRVPAPPAARPDVGDAVGPYRLVRLLGSGGMADVYEAVHPLFAAPVALKIARSDDDRTAAHARLELEAAILCQLRHPVVACIYDAGRLPCGTPWFAMELIVGETLAARLTRGPLDIGYGCRLLAHLASALRGALQAGVVHRDLKPDNIILERGVSGRCKLIDWGIARVPAATTRNTEVGLTAGTPGYMAPEQARGHEVDWRSDVYALGVTAFEMLCGTPPFEAKTSLDLVVKHLCDAPPPPTALRPDLPPRLEALLLSMLAKTPADRPRLADLEVQLRAIARRLDEAEVEITLEYDVELDEEAAAERDAAEHDERVAIERAATEPADISESAVPQPVPCDEDVIPLTRIKRPGLLAAAVLG